MKKVLNITKIPSTQPMLFVFVVPTIRIHSSSHQHLSQRQHIADWPDRAESGRCKHTCDSCCTVLNSLSIYASQYRQMFHYSVWRHSRGKKRVMSNRWDVTTASCRNPVGNVTPFHMDNLQDLFMYDTLYCSKQGIQQHFFLHIQSSKTLQRLIVDFFPLCIPPPTQLFL